MGEENLVLKNDNHPQPPPPALPPPPQQSSQPTSPPPDIKSVTPNQVSRRDRRNLDNLNVTIYGSGFQDDASVILKIKNYDIHPKKPISVDPAKIETTFDLRDIIKLFDMWLKALWSLPIRTGKRANPK